MKIAQQVMSIVILFFVINVQAMAKTAVEKLEKEAWKQAFQGHTSAALETFTQAASNGSWQAAKFLAYNYGKEPLLDQKDETKAQLFVQLAERYKKENPREYFSEFILESKIEKYKSLQFARANRWYQEVLDFLNSKESSLFKTYPAPEKSVMCLFNKINDDKTDEQIALNCMRLLTQTMGQVQSEQVTRDIFAQVNAGYRSFSFSKDATTNYCLCKDMIITLEESALKQGLVQEIKTAYGKLFSLFHGDYLGIGYKVEKETIVQTIQELFPRYMALCPQKAATKLIHFFEYDIKHSWRLDDGFLKLLRLLPHPVLEKYITDLSGDHRVNVIKALCISKDLAPAFQGTVLDFDLLAQKAFHSDLDKEAMSVLIALLKSGNKDFYQKYQDDIIAVLPIFLQKAAHEYKTVINLATDSGIPVLQKNVLRVLVEYTANTQEDYFWRNCVIENLFENSGFSSEEKNELYQLMDAAYHAQKCIHGLQLLWLHLKDNQEHRELVRSSLSQYFNTDLSQDAGLSFENLLHQALTLAQQKITISHDQFLQVIEIAHETKLATYIDPTFLAAQKDAVIFDPNRSFQERVLFLDQRLCAIPTGVGMASFSHILNKDLVGDDIRIYARDIFTALFGQSFEVCKAKKSLQEMHKKYGLKGSVPEIVWNISRDLENFAYYRHRPIEQRTTDRISLNARLCNSQLSCDGLLYASSAQNAENCYLWAIDAKTLDAVWQIKVKNYEHVQGKQPKFVLYDDLIYLVDGMEIRTFNRKTGKWLHSFALEGLPVVRLIVDTSGLLYVVQGDDPCNKNTVITIDPVTGETALFESNIDGGGKQYFIAGQTFGYYYVPDCTITLYAKDGSGKVIPLCADKEEPWFFRPELTTKDNQIIFTQCTEKDNYCLVCYDTSNNTQVWSFPLDEKIKTEPCVSSDGQSIFIVKKKNIVALHINEGDVQELWSFDIPGERGYSLDVIDELAISPDGKVLFALNVHCGDLYTINAHDGTLIAKTVCDEGRSRYLVGVSDDNLPYIQPVYY